MHALLRPDYSNAQLHDHRPVTADFSFGGLVKKVSKAAMIKHTPAIMYDRLKLPTTSKTFPEMMGKTSPPTPQAVKTRP